MSSTKRKFEDCRDDDTDRSSSSSKAVKNSSENGGLDPADPGQVIEVYVENFMCHRKMTVKFGQHVNFVTGSNGSGKSAIVAAIQLCLGSSARATGRDANASKLIREGSDGPAVMRVTLRNEGRDAFSPELYGDKIQIERRIYKAGNRSEYRVSSGGREISCEKRELDKITSHFCIHVTNPTCVLTQEESKKFIQGTDQEKYHFFLMATGLERAKEELLKMGGFLDETRAGCEPLKQVVQGKRERSNRLKGELQEHLNMTKMEDDIRDFSAKILWLVVSEQHEISDKVAERVRLIEDKVAEQQRVCDEFSTEMTEMGSIENIQVQLESISKTIEELNAEVNSKQQQNTELKKAVNGVKASVRSLTTAQRDNDLRLQAVRSEIQETRDRALATSEGQERQLRESLSANERSLAINGEKEQTLRGQRNEALRKLQENQKSLEQVAMKMDGIRQTVQRDQASLREMSADSARGQLAIFDSEMPNIMRDIQLTRFRDVVMGPLGSKISIREGFEQSGQALEVVLNRSLSAFLVTNDEDFRSLKQILRNRRCDNRITIFMCSSRSRYPPERILQTQGTRTAHDALVIEDDLVYNCIIDQNRPEDTALAPSEEFCMKELVKTANGLKQFCSHARSCVTDDGTRISFVNGNKSSEVNRQPYRRLLEKDVTASRNSLQQAVTENERLLHEHDQEFKGLQQDGEALKAGVKTLDSSMGNCLNEKKVLERERRDIEIRLNDVVEATTADTSYLEREEEELRDAIDLLKVQLEGENGKLEAMAGELQQRAQDRSQAGRKKAASEAEFEKLQRRLENFIHDHENKLRERAKAEKLLEKRLQELAGAKHLFDQENGKYDAALAKARHDTPELIRGWDGQPVELSGRDTAGSLNARIRAMEKRLEEERRSAGLGKRTLEEVQSQYEEAKADWKQSKALLDKMMHEIGQLQGDFEARKKTLSKSLKRTTEAVNTAFNEYMKKKQDYVGNVVVDHPMETLTLRCSMNASDVHPTYADVRQLSGGQRSYTTLCFLMALGRVIECPFRVMDEYDVFLDEPTRQETLTQMQRYAQTGEQLRRQFIIVTPNTLSSITTTDKVRIHRMQTAQRTSSHGLQQTTL